MSVALLAISLLSALVWVVAPGMALLALATTVVKIARGRFLGARWWVVVAAAALVLGTLFFAVAWSDYPGPR